MLEPRGEGVGFLYHFHPGGTEYSFRRIMKEFEGRFGAKELTETFKAKFHQAQQWIDESLNDWADRVLTLATPAFRDLPYKHCRNEAISKFCQGCVDREAGKHVCLEQPRSMEDALDRVKHFQYISQASRGVEDEDLIKFDEEPDNGTSCFSSGTETKAVSVCRVCAGSSSVPIIVKARMDSGAEITIISTAVYDKLKKKPKMVKDAVMYMADQDSALQSVITEPVHLKLGKNAFSNGCMWRQSTTSCCWGMVLCITGALFMT